MKSLLILLPLLVACGGGSNGGSSKPDVRTMCLSMDMDCRNPRIAEAVLHSWSSSYTLTATEFVLNNLLPEREAQNCGLDPQPGKRYSYELIGGELLVDDSKVIVTFTKAENKNQLYGEWRFSRSTDRAMRDGSIKFTGGTVEIKGSCYR